MQLPELPPTLTIPEGAKRWMCSPNKLRAAIAKGELPAIKPGNKILIRIDEGDMHLSDHNSDEALFKREIQQLAGVPVYVCGAKGEGQ